MGWRVSLLTHTPAAQGYGAGMAEDWRVTFAMDPGERGAHSRALEAVREHDVEHEARERLGGRVAVSRDDDRIFLYADTRARGTRGGRPRLDTAGRAWPGPRGRARRSSAGTRSRSGGRTRPSHSRRPRPSARPSSERREADEDAEAHASGEAPWEVRIEFAEHDDADRVRRSARAGGPCRSCAAGRSCSSAPTTRTPPASSQRGSGRRRPSGAQIEVEPGGGPVWDVYGNNPFAFFGGLAG